MSLLGAWKRKKKIRGKCHVIFWHEKARLWQAQLKVIRDFLLPGPGVWQHWKDGGLVEFHDGASEATHLPDGPHVFHFGSSLVKAIQTSLVTAWKQCSEKPKELPLYQLRSESGN